MGFFPPPFVQELFTNTRLFGLKDTGYSANYNSLLRQRAELEETLLQLLSTTGDVLTIPVAALVEQGNQTLVYTGYDEENEILRDPISVTVGRSVGENAEIPEGLAAGQTYYYAYYDTLEISFTPDFGAGGFMFG